MAAPQRDRADVAVQRHAAPLKIVHIITRFIRGGADENTLLTVNGQARHGHAVELIVGDHHPAIIAALDPHVTLRFEPTLVRAIRPLSDLRCLFRLLAHLRRARPDVVHSHESKAGIIGRVAAWMAGVPIVVHGVHILPFLGVSRAQAALYLRLEKCVAPMTDAFVDVSEGMRDTCLGHGLGHAGNHFVVASGMDGARFRNAAPVANLPGDAAAVTGLMAGTLEPRKRIAELISAMAEHRQSAVNWRLLIAGHGAQQRALEQLIPKLGLEEKIFLLGHRDDLDQLIASADICIHAARNEGLPRVLVQYVLGGRAVLVAALPGIERVVHADGNGVIVASDDIVGLAANFLALADDGDRRARMAAASAAIDLSAWEADRMVNAIDAIYRGLEARS
ncbi:MAG: glycosyltransferase [Pseudomonadota bacterium]|nr:glycosyltransferase [Pseudomonadota bacterium]